MEEVSQKEPKKMRMDEHTAKKNNEKGNSCENERRLELSETTTGTKRVSVFLRGIAKQLSNQVRNGATSHERQRPLLVSDPFLKKSDLSRKMYPITEGCIMKDPANLLQACKVWDKEKRQYNGQLNPVIGHDEGLISKTGVNHLHEILSYIHGGMYQSSPLLLDVNSAGNNVAVKSDLKSAFWTVEDQCYPKSRKRFKDPQVLTINSFHSGQHIWVVETSKSGNWRIGMCYPSIARKGFRSYIGCSDKSWGLCKWNNEYSVMHNCKEVHLSPGLSCQRLVICLDYKAGQLSFYELSNPVRLLHTFTTTFTEPLHMVFRIWLDSLGSSWILIRD